MEVVHETLVCSPFNCQMWLTAQTMTLQMESAFEMLVYLKHLTQLSAWGGFIKWKLTQNLKL
jgi:hypothetical protein